MSKIMYRLRMAAEACAEEAFRTPQPCRKKKCLELRDRVVELINFAEQNFKGKDHGVSDE